MNMQLIQKIGKKFMKKVPVIKAGNTVRVHQRIKEGGKERIQIFEGLVIAVNSGTGPDKTFTVRKMVGSIGVEKIFPLYSKNITKIQVTKLGDVRRSKLYYMRKRSGKSARLKEKHLTEKDVIMEDFEPTEAPAEVSGESEVRDLAAKKEQKRLNEQVEPVRRSANEAEPKAEEKAEAAPEEKAEAEEKPTEEEAPKKEKAEDKEADAEPPKEDPAPAASDSDEEPKE